MVVVEQFGRPVSPNPIRTCNLPRPALPGGYVRRARLRGMSPLDRQHAVTHLAVLLIEVARSRMVRATMNGSEVLPLATPQRKAVVYMRQSTQTQVDVNAEGRLRQYGLIDAARRRVFQIVEVIDDDLGRSVSCMLDAVQATFRRGELWITGPIGCFWYREVGLGLDTDARSE